MLLFTRLVGDGLVGPNLTVRMRIAATHHLAAVFEDLDVIDEWQGADLSDLVDPDINDGANIFDLHARESQVVTRRKAHYLANATLGFGEQESAAEIILVGGAKIRA